MSLGTRLKRLRENRRMSVRGLAEAVGVSRSFIYQLERGEVSPSYSTLQAMARALGTTVSVLVGDMSPEEWLVVRRAGRRRVVVLSEDEAESRSGPAGDGSGPSRVELLPFLGSRNRRMQPVVVEVAPGGRLDSLPFVHEREDLIFVTAGELTLTLQDGRTIRLATGDAAYLLFETVESLANEGDEPAVCLWVVSPPG